MQQNYSARRADAMDNKVTTKRIIMSWAFQLIVLQKAEVLALPNKVVVAGVVARFSWLYNMKANTRDRNVLITKPFDYDRVSVTCTSQLCSSDTQSLLKLSTFLLNLKWENNQTIVKTHLFWDPKSKKRKQKFCVHAKASKWSNWAVESNKAEIHLVLNSCLLN